MGRREAWLANALMMVVGTIIFVLTIALIVAGIANFAPPGG